MSLDTLVLRCGACGHERTAAAICHTEVVTEARGLDPRSVRRVGVTPLTRRRRARAGCSNSPAGRRILGCHARGGRETYAVLEVWGEEVQLASPSTAEASRVYVVAEVGATLFSPQQRPVGNAGTP